VVRLWCDQYMDQYMDQYTACTNGQASVIGVPLALADVAESQRRLQRW
jgi:hypothetical protein